MRIISVNPSIGLRREDLPATHRAYHVGSHIIVYRLGPAETGIVRILHQRMSVAKHM